jgi:hypothetical protein
MLIVGLALGVSTAALFSISVAMALFSTAVATTRLERLATAAVSAQRPCNALPDQGAAADRPV